MTLDHPAAQPETALDRALFTAERDLRRVMLAAGWPRSGMDLLAKTIAEVVVGAAYRSFKEEISAWKREVRP